MTKPLTSILVALILLSLTACGGPSRGNVTSKGDVSDSRPQSVAPSQDASVKGNLETNVKLTFDGHVIIVRLQDSSTVRSLLKQLPLTLEFKDYAGTEKISYLPNKLDTTDARDGYDPLVGDLTYYTPWGNLAFFYKDSVYASGLVPIGTIEVGADLVSRLGGSGSVIIQRMD